MYLANLVRQKKSEDEIWIDSFHVEDSVKDAQQAFRDAVADFLSTDGGQASAADTNYDFNWGDAVTTVPTWIWNKHGLYPVQNSKTVDILVNQDEILCE